MNNSRVKRIIQKQKSYEPNNNAAFDSEMTDLQYSSKGSADDTEDISVKTANFLQIDN